MSGEEDQHGQLVAAARTRRIAVFVSGRDRYAGWAHIHLVEKRSGQDMTLASFHSYDDALRWLCPTEAHDASAR